MEQKLEDLIPRETEITLRRVSVALRVRPCSLADDVWAKNKFGKPIEQVLMTPTLEDIVQIFYRLLETESKAEFKRTKVKAVDEGGRETEVEIGGVELLMTIIEGGGELLKISRAIMESVGFSRPVLTKAEEEAVKKNSKLRDLLSPTTTEDGSESLTSSPTSTVGQPSTCSVAP